MNRSSKKLSCQEIDDIIVSEANDNSRWTKAISVYPKKSVAVFLTPETAQKLKNAARRRHVKNYHRWVNQIVEQHLAG